MHQPPTATLSHPNRSCDTSVTIATVTLTAVTVSPALVEPTPLVNTDRGINFVENFKNCDLAVPVCNSNPQYVTVTFPEVEKTHYLDHLLIVNETLLSHDYLLLLSSVMITVTIVTFSHTHLNTTNQNEQNRQLYSI